jgi:hypothetical protein
VQRRRVGRNALHSSPLMLKGFVLDFLTHRGFILPFECYNVEATGFRAIASQPVTLWLI